jgi:hypothetical protein
VPIKKRTGRLTTIVLIREMESGWCSAAVENFPGARQRCGRAVGLCRQVRGGRVRARELRCGKLVLSETRDTKSCPMSTGTGTPLGEKNGEVGVVKEYEL